MTSAGRPDSGPGSIAPLAPRLGGFLVDTLLASLVAFVFTAPDLPQNRSLVAFAVLYFGSTLLVAQTAGMRLAKLRVVRTDRAAAVGLWRSAVRTVLVILVVPALLRDADGRALHDRITNTAVVRAG